MADPKVNNSRMSYRKRVFKETKMPEPRKFRPGIFVEDEDDCKDRNMVELFEKDLKDYSRQAPEVSNVAGRYKISLEIM